MATEEVLGLSTFKLCVAKLTQGSTDCRLGQICNEEPGAVSICDICRCLILKCTNLPSSLDYLSRFHNTKLVYVATTVNVMKKYYGPSPSVLFSLESFLLFSSDCLSFPFEFLLDFYCRFQVLSCETMSAAEWPISPQPIIFLASRSIFSFLNRPIAERLTINVSYLMSGGQFLTLVFLRSPSLAS